jgi:hypothetical protein
LLKRLIKIYILAKKPNKGGTPHSESMPNKKKNFKEPTADSTPMEFILFKASALTNENRKKKRVNVIIYTSKFKKKTIKIPSLNSEP